MQPACGKTLIMGVLNVTADSFSDGGQFSSRESAARQIEKMVNDGADIIDIGGESSRPGAVEISAEEEQRGVLPVIKMVIGKFPIKISVDTRKPNTAAKCLELGVDIINDISGLEDLKMRETVAAYKSGVVIMHMKGNPRTMQENPVYGDVIAEIRSFLKERAEEAERSGIDRSKIIIDPGIGFGKTAEHNLQIIKRLKEFSVLGFPVMIGPSRKSFIGKITGLPVHQRLEGTLAALAISIMNGAAVVRVHDVAEAKKAALIADAVKNS